MDKFLPLIEALPESGVVPFPEYRNGLYASGKATAVPLYRQAVKSGAIFEGFVYNEALGENVHVVSRAPIVRPGADN